MIIGVIRRRRVDAIGVLVLGGIALGAVLGLVSHHPKLVLDEGSVATTAFGLVCLGSLATARPLLYRVVLEFTGPDTPRGREFADYRDRPGHLHRAPVYGRRAAECLEDRLRPVLRAQIPAGTLTCVA